MIVVLKTQMTDRSWTVFGVLLGLIIPPAFYSVFDVLTICLGYKVLIWAGVIFFLAGLLRCGAFIKLLNRLGDWAYSKRTVS
jgi:hypothetical protein